MTMAEKPLERVTGLRMIRGRASLESIFCCLALTLPVKRDPATIPTVRTVSKEKVVVRWPLRSLPQRPRPELFDDSIALVFLVHW